MSAYAVEAMSDVEATAPTLSRAAQRTPSPGRGRRDLNAHELDAVRRVRSSPLQATLAVGRSDDPLEHEAERVAAHIVSSPAPIGLVQRACACGGTPGPDGECAKCRAKRLGVQRASARQGTRVGPIDTVGDAEQKIAAVQGGRPLPTTQRAFFEPRLGVDLRQVRIHDGAAADEAARSIGAVAYTRGGDIVFRRGSFAPETSAGRHLLAHELTHVVQQGAVSARADANPSASGQARSGGVVQRLTDEDSQEAGPATERASSPSLPPVSIEEAERIGREALDTMGYEEVIARALAAGLLRAPDAPDDTPAGSSPAPEVQRQAAEGFWAVFTRYAVAAGVSSQVDSPAPGPGDVVAVGILVFGLFAALAATTSTTARVCPPCPAPPAPEVDRVPPSTPHFPCPGDHWHYYGYNQNPVTCQCFGPRRLFGGCCGFGSPGAPC